MKTFINRFRPSEASRKHLLFFLFFLLIGGQSFGQEDCFNGIDDDADALIDLNDPDCDCASTESGEITGIIPNPSFEENTGCPVIGISETDLVNNWTQGGSGTSDYWNLCGATGFGTLVPAPDTPLPDGDGYVGFFNTGFSNEYIGTCLDAPFLAGEEYTLQVSIAFGDDDVSSFSLTLFGSTTCGDLPWTGTDCPEGIGSWEELGSSTVTFTTVGEWLIAEIVFTPLVDINVIALGPPCGDPTDPGYYYLDDLVLITDDMPSVEGTITETGGFCAGDLILTAEVDTIASGTWQWYEDGIAIIGETGATLDLSTLGAGNYTAMFTLTEGGTCAQIEHTVAVPDAPTANFNFTSTCDGITVNFTDSSFAVDSSVIVDYDWDFGDGGTSTDMNPTHVFPASGDYDITLTVTDDNGCQNTLVETITVSPSTSVPTASVPEPLMLQCSADLPLADPEVITDEAGSGTIVVALVSDVSDGGTCPETITRTYSITDDCGSIEVAHIITINDTIPPIAIIPADLTVSCPVDVPAVDLSVITGVSDNCSSDPVVAFVSETNEGTVCVDQSITRTYSITDDCGNVTMINHKIFINATFPSVTAGDDIEGCEGISVTLRATNPEDAVISWSGGIVDDVSFIPPVGTNNYTVTAESCDGLCVSTDDVIVEIYDLPEVAFEGDDLIGCIDHEVNFTNLSSTSFACTWDFGDGTIINDCGPINHIYNTPGDYDVSLTVTTGDNCVNSITFINYVQVESFPIADFSFTPDHISFDFTTISFTNLSTFADTYEWTFDPLGTSTAETNPDYTFPYVSGASYTVNLEASNSLGCSDIHSITINTIDENIYYVPNAFTPDGDEFNNEFKPVFTSGFDPFDYHLSIFNRWGELIFESFNSEIGWSGNYGAGNELAQDGIYIWKIEFGELATDEIHTETGHVTLLK